MPFPQTRTVRGKRAGTPKEVLDSIEAELRALGAIHVARTQDAITFRVPVTAGRPQSSVDGGRCTVEESEPGRSHVSLELSFRRTAAILATLTVAWVGGVAWYLLGARNLTELVAMLSIGFLWLHGVSYLIASWWFRRELSLASDDGERDSG